MCVLIGFGFLLPGAANFTPSQSTKPTLPGRPGGGDAGEKKRDTEVQRTDGTCQVEPFNAHAQPKMFSKCATNSRVAFPKAVSMDTVQPCGHACGLV